MKESIPGSITTTGGGQLDSAAPREACLAELGELLSYYFKESNAPKRPQWHCKAHGHAFAGARMATIIFEKHFPAAPADGAQDASTTDLNAVPGTTTLPNPQTDGRG